jgi:hypothetical protein
MISEGIRLVVVLQVFLAFLLSPVLSRVGVAMPHGQQATVAADVSNRTDDATSPGREKKEVSARQVEYDVQTSIGRHLLSVGVRARFSSRDVLGKVALEPFQSGDLVVSFRLPWGWYSPAAWGIGARLMTGAGILYGAGETAVVVSVIPLASFGSRDGRFSIDGGAGGALLSRRRFGEQDLGGHFQFVLTAGVGIPLYRQLGMGYRFMHYSDAAIYGQHNTGADLHMLELTYRF